MSDCVTATRATMVATSAGRYDTHAVRSTKVLSASYRQIKRFSDATPRTRRSSIWGGQNEKHLGRIVALARDLGGIIRASDVQSLGFTREGSIRMLIRYTVKGHFERRESGADPLKPGKWEPTYRLI
jgi:hypothetical protein